MTDQQTRTTQVLYLYSAFVTLIGFLGLYRTGSWIPVFISIGIALITLALLAWYRSGSSAGRGVMALWLSICLLVFVASALDMVGAHANPQPGYRWIFGSEAFFAALALFATLRR